jgi:hypothetical protein
LRRGDRTRSVWPRKVAMRAWMTGAASTCGLERGGGGVKSRPLHAWPPATTSLRLRPPAAGQHLVDGGPPGGVDGQHRPHQRPQLRTAARRQRRVRALDNLMGWVRGGAGSGVGGVESEGDQALRCMQKTDRPCPGCGRPSHTLVMSARRLGASKGGRRAISSYSTQPRLQMSVWRGWGAGREGRGWGRWPCTVLAGLKRSSS